MPGTVTGRPASSEAMRATLRLSSPAPLALPSTTSSTSAGSRSVRSSAARRTPAARSSGRVLARDHRRTCRTAYEPRCRRRPAGRCSSHESAASGASGAASAPTTTVPTTIGSAAASQTAMPPRRVAASSLLALLPAPRPAGVVGADVRQRDAAPAGRRRGADERVGPRHLAPARTPRGAAADRPAQRDRRRRRCRQGRGRRQAEAGARRAPGAAAGAERFLVGRRGDRSAGREGPGAVRRGRVERRGARDVPREASAVGRAGGVDERPGEHRAVAAADVDRRVRGHRAAPGVAPPRPRLRALQPPLVLQGRPARGQRRGRGAAAQRPQGPGRHDDVPDRRARRRLRAVRLPAQRPRRHRGRVRVPLRLRGGAGEVPPDARAARRLLAAADGRDVPRCPRQRDRRRGVLRRPPPAGRPRHLHAPLRGPAPGLHRRLAPEARRRTSRAGATAGRRTTTCSRSSGRRARWSSASTAGRRRG